MGAEFSPLFLSGSRWPQRAAASWKLRTKGSFWHCRISPLSDTSQPPLRGLVNQQPFPPMFSPALALHQSLGPTRRSCLGLDHRISSSSNKVGGGRGSSPIPFWSRCEGGGSQPWSDIAKGAVSWPPSEGGPLVCMLLHWHPSVGGQVEPQLRPFRVSVPQQCCCLEQLQ